jgi:aquaporin Z
METAIQNPKSEIRNVDVVIQNLKSKIQNLHWPEYLIEAAALGVFMFSACAFGVLLDHPASPGRHAIDDPFARRALTGLAMGLTALAIFYSPWGKQSGAHINPAVTLTFLRLGKVDPRDALFYTLAQFAGAYAGVVVAALALGAAVADGSVNYAVTMPGPGGAGVAFAAELAIAFLMMLTVLIVSNSARFASYTGLAASILVALYITLEAPLSGMSLNPARTLGSALVAERWEHLWVYVTAPPLGMLLAAEAYLRLDGAGAVFCAKLHHANTKRCIFCDYRMRCQFTPEP